MPSSRRLFTQTVLYALALARLMAGNIRLARMPMIASTTSNSINVKAVAARFGGVLLRWCARIACAIGAESGRGQPHSGTLRVVCRIGGRASALECGCPLPLLSPRERDGQFCYTRLRGRCPACAALAALCSHVATNETLTEQCCAFIQSDIAMVCLRGFKLRCPHLPGQSLLKCSRSRARCTRCSGVSLAKTSFGSPGPGPILAGPNLGRPGGGPAKPIPILDLRNASQVVHRPLSCRAAARRQWRSNC